MGVIPPGTLQARMVMTASSEKKILCDLDILFSLSIEMMSSGKILSTNKVTSGGLAYLLDVEKATYLGKNFSELLFIGILLLFD